MQKYPTLLSISAYKNTLYFRGTLLLWAHKPTDDAWVTELVTHKARVQESYKYILLLLGMKNLSLRMGTWSGSNSLLVVALYENPGLLSAIYFFFFFPLIHLLANFKETEKNISLQRI